MGDKVMQVKNDYDKGVFNGDIGTIERLDAEKQVLYVRFDYTLEYDQVDLDQLTLAYAISIHRAQGSEFPVVVLPLTTQHYVMLQRNLLYTAITRAKQMIVIVGTPKALKLGHCQRQGRPALHHTQRAAARRGRRGAGSGRSCFAGSDAAERLIPQIDAILFNHYRLGESWRNISSLAAEQPLQVIAQQPAHGVFAATSRRMDSTARGWVCPGDR